MRVLEHQNKNKTDNRGFTVLELMIVIGIMVMMLTLTIPNFKSFDRNQILETETEKLFSVLRQAQVWALTGQTISSARYNFGVHFIQCASAPGCQYIFFKDGFTGGDKEYDTGEEYGIGQVTLGNGVYVSAIDPGGNALDIVFEVPAGKIYFNGAEAGTDSAAVTLTSYLSDRDRTITVSGDSGQINIQ